MNDWGQANFDAQYLDFHRPILTKERTRREVAFVRRHLGVAAGARLLDVPCGFGRHSLELARLGYRVSGLDYSRVMLDKARHDAAGAGLEIDFCQGDMRQLPFNDGEFEAAIMLFTSFGYLGRQGDRQSLAELARVLRPGGRLILDQQNPWPIIAWAEVHGQRLGDGRYEIRAPLEEHEGTERMVWDPAQRLITVDETWNGRPGTRHLSYQVLAYTSQELEELLRGVGFGMRQIYGGFDGRAFRPGAERMILAAERGRS